MCGQHSTLKPDYMRLKRLEHHTSLLAKAMKTAFLHIEGRLADLDNKIDNVINNLKTFMSETTRQFKYTWQITVANRLAIKLLSSGSAMYDHVLHQYLQYYINYQVIINYHIKKVGEITPEGVAMTYQELRKQVSLPITSFGALPPPQVTSSQLSVAA